MRPLFPEPPGREKKPPFTTIPPAILKQISALTGSPVIAGNTAFGGLSAAAGYILTLADGREVFAKGNHPEEMAHGTANLRQEIDTYQRVPVLRDISPRHLGIVGDGDEDGWLLGIWESVGRSGSPLPQAAIETMAAFQKQFVPPKALDAARDHNYLRFFFDGQRKWMRLRDEEKVRQKFTALFADARLAEKWLGKNLDALIARLALKGLSSPEGLIHGDLRLDNFIFTPQKVYVVDWPNAAIGPIIFDALFFFSSLEGQGYGLVEEHLLHYKKVSATDFSNEDLVMMLAALSGYFADQAGRAIPEKLPRLRWMQKGMLLAQLRMLQRLGAVDSLPEMLDSSR